MLFHAFINHCLTHLYFIFIEFWKNHDGVTSVEAIKALGISDDLVEVEETLDSESDIDDGKQIANGDTKCWLPTPG